MKFIFINIFLLVGILAHGQKIGLLKYEGGGDWYSNPTSLSNLIAFANENISTKIDAQAEEVEPDSPEIFRYPYIHMTGHGNVYFSEEAAKNLRNYMLSGGFLHADDNYGMEPYFREAIKKVFPNRELKELSSNHPIFKNKFVFENGLPKIHEHDGKPPQAFAIEDDNGRIMLLFTYESDLGNGWEDESVHNDPKEIRLKALKMGSNILKYAFLN
ncbi:DUF4159 domain-containing protein [Psychroflexus aestuariivivens]|uniref:DUF4159 domain-containing protein n=1 Tax=Psychroflexus aestuariivivens TaxID=1795040 RepID=UPI000FD7AE06|nr:DUF4159 domain-containing protein [Psychroflexus aestuariivivens]